MEKKIWVNSYDKGISSEIDASAYSSIAHLMRCCFDKFSDLPAFHNMGTTMSYQQLKEGSQKFATYLQTELGLQKGDRVGLMLPNVLQYPIALFGILQAGMIVVNINPLYTARELEHQLKDSGTKAIVILANAAHLLEQVISNTEVKHVVVTEVGEMLKFPKSMIVNFVVKRVKKMVPAYHIPQAITFKDALAKGSTGTYHEPNINLDDIAFLQYTGGTTGVAKGAILTHGNIVANIMQAKEWIKFGMEDGKEIMITPLPLYHIFSLTANCFTFSACGALNVLITNPRDIPGFVKELKKWKFTAITGVNTLFNALLNNEDFRDVDFSALKVCLGGGMAVQKAVAEKWKQITGKPLVEAYGLTETSPAACINPMTLKDYNGSVGLPISSTIVKIKNDNGVDLPLGEVGEVCIKGPQVMKGYWQKPEETAKVMVGDFLKTGDMGFMTEDGYIKLVDRKKDMILVSGFNVYPNEVEDVVCSNPKVLEAAAIGVPDEKSGEKIKLYVVKKDETLTEEELLTHCRESLTSYKVPKEIEFRKEPLPKSTVGKILRRELKVS